MPLDKWVPPKTQLFGDLSKEDHNVFESLTECSLKLFSSTTRRIRDNLVVKLHENRKVLLKFLERFATFGDIQYYAKRRFSEDVHSSAFIKQNLKTKYGLQFIVYWKDPVELLAEQVAITKKKDLISEYVPLPHYTHPLNSMIGRDVAALVENYIKKNRDKDVRRRVTRIDGEQSCVCFSQASAIRHTPI